MDAREIEADLTEVLITEAEIRAKLAELARQIEPTTTAAPSCSSAS